MFSKKLNQILNFRQKKLKLNFKNMTNDEVFTKIYDTNFWNGNESRSGPGSDLIQTKTIRTELPKLFKELEVTSLLDIPCGDFFWLKEVNMDFLNYTGGDIVQDIITKNNLEYSNKNRKFVKLDIINHEVPKTDLILCRDVFPHFSFENIIKSIKNIKKSGSKYLLTTSFPSKKNNQDIVTGDWRPLNLNSHPFNFPKPSLIINEHCSEIDCTDKSLLLWKIIDL